MKENTGNKFSKYLLKWNSTDNKRQMPWKGERDAYRIWLSEIILQQTRVEQGIGYYERFITQFPTIQSLADASEEAVFKLWEGLGYYSRCRNLIASAKFIQAHHKGIFPSTYEEIIALKGIGPYTAAAIGSFAFQLPYAVVDGNVFRVLSRVFGIDSAIDSTLGKKQFTQLANQLLPHKCAGTYNQAIMDFGALICKPVPDCRVCPLQKICWAYQHQKQSELPVKTKKIIRRQRYFYYVIPLYQGKTLLRKRTADIWRGLHEFLLMESGQQLLQEQFERSALYLSVAAPHQKPIKKMQVVQQLTHQTIDAHFYFVRVEKLPDVPNYFSASLAQINQLAFPRAMRDVVEALNKIIAEGP